MMNKRTLYLGTISLCAFYIFIPPKIYVSGYILFFACIEAFIYSLIISFSTDGVDKGYSVLLGIIAGFVNWAITLFVAHPSVIYSQVGLGSIPNMYREFFNVSVMAITGAIIFLGLIFVILRPLTTSKTVFLFCCLLMPISALPFLFQEYFGDYTVQTHKILWFAIFSSLWHLTYLISQKLTNKTNQFVPGGTGRPMLRIGRRCL